MAESYEKPLSTCWCHGLPLVATRVILSRERAELLREMWRMRIIGWVLGTLSPIFFLVALAIAAGGDLSSATPLILALLVIVLTAIGFIIANQNLVRAKGIRTDLRRGYWLRFEGLCPSEEHDDIPLSAHAALGSFLGQPICLDVLPASFRLWRINDQPVSGWATVALTETADLPEIADIAAQWLDRIGEADGHVLSAGRRELSDTEKDEIRRHMRHSWRKPLLPTLISVPWASILCGFLIVTGTPFPQGWNGGMFTGLLIIALVSFYRQVQGIRMALRLRNDVREGSVLIVSATPTEGNTTDTETTLVELLPNANLHWTEQGKPAAWRRC